MRSIAQGRAEFSFEFTRYEEAPPFVADKVHKGKRSAMINCLLEANVQKYIDLLRNSKIFSNTGDSDIVRLLERAEAVHCSYKKGEIILADGTKPRKQASF